MKTSQNILNYLEINGPSTVAELSAAMERTKADIREQIGQLLVQNRVERLTANRLDTPGRPAARFALVQKTPEPLVKGLMVGLMGFLNKQSLNHENEEVLVELITNSIVSNFQPQGFSSASRMNQAVAYLDTIGIKTTWIATRSGPKITIVFENISPLLQQPSLSKKVVKQLITKLKEKAAGS